MAHQLQSRIIINNLSDLSDEEALHLVSRVVAQGKVSNRGKQYCYATVFALQREHGWYDYVVYTNLTRKGTHVFYIYKDGPSQIKEVQ